MNFHIIKSYAKINLSLNIIKRLKNRYHRIESLVTFINFYDEIKIKKIDGNKNKISFSGDFSKKIKKENTISKLLKILEKKKILKNQKFEIVVIKNIPQKSGMGGGSMNAASIFKYLISKKIIKMNNRYIDKISHKVGSDVILGLKKKNSIFLQNRRVVRLEKKINLFTLIVKPTFGCSTKNIYAGVKKYSKPLYNNKNKSHFKMKNLADSKNDLENIVFKKYPTIKGLKNFLIDLPNVIFVRMTGSGSAIVAYFKTKKSANIASKIFKRKYKNYWYIISKTI